ncbi:MAG: winged helix DNA-binding domain-containing protein [Nocardiaceae bacterium]|nr:winged helix DNA-binding domain-containing protein [Nocardiaceae bacterium]
MFLLPGCGFDEFILGYRDRGATVDASFENRLQPGGNGMFSPTVVDGGRVVGTWKRAGRGTAARARAIPFTAFTARTEKAIPRAFAALA